MNTLAEVPIQPLLISRGLVIRDPWIGYILDGTKTWEMRAKPTNKRGWIGLIKKGSGAVTGMARLVDVGRPLSPDEMISYHEQHRIPVEMIGSGEVAKWTVPWVLSDVRALREPVPYNHKSGAVVWVELEEVVASSIIRQVEFY